MNNKNVLIALGAVVVLGILWMAIQTKPDDNVPQATINIESESENQGQQLTTTPDVSNTPAGELKKVNNSNVKVSFIGFGPGKKHLGSFSKVNSNLVLNADSKITGSISVDIASLSTDTEAVTKHLKTPDFFDAAKYPTATFTVKNHDIAKGSMSGTFTIHGVTKDISFPVTKTDTEYKSNFTINMKEFGINQKFANETIELSVVVPVK